MTLVVEDGTRVTGANTYVTVQELTDYAAARGITITADPEQLLIKSMDFIETLSFIGLRYTQLQPLQWPRVYVYINDYYINADKIPIQLKNGQIEVALAIDNGQDPLADIPRLKSSVKVGDIQVTYDKSQATTMVRKISSSLYKILNDGITGSSFKVGRG